MDRRSRTRLPPRRAQTSTAVAAAKEARPPPFSTCPCECSPWLQRGLEAAEETLRPHNDDREIESEYDESLVGRVEQEAADGSTRPINTPARRLPRMLPNPPSATAT